MEREDIKKLAFDSAKENKTLNDIREKDPILYLGLFLSYCDGFLDCYKKMESHLVGDIKVSMDGNIEKGGEQ